MFGALIRRQRRRGGEVVEALPDAAASRDSTMFSLTTDVPRPAEPQPGDALADDLPIAKLVAPAGQALCRIRAITAGGMVADVASEIAVGTPIMVELDSERRVKGQAVWTRGGHVGIKFDRDVDLRDFLPRQRVRGHNVARPPRLDIACAASVKIGKFYHKVEVRDISLGGIKVALRDANCVGKKVVVNVESLRPVKGTIRWYAGGKAGIVFDRPLAFEELAEWMSKRVEFACLKAGARG